MFGQPKKKTDEKPTLNVKTNFDEGDSSGEGSAAAGGAPAAGGKAAAGSFVDPELVKAAKEALGLPTPQKSDYWKIEAIILERKKGKGVLGIFKKKGLSDEEISELRKAALTSPGNTQTKIKKLMKDYPNEPTLHMLSAICTHGMIMNSSSQKTIIPGLKSATKDAAMALMSDGISIYNCENFFRIYFILVDRFKRFQIKTFEQVRMEPRLDTNVKPLTAAMHLCDYLSSDKAKTMNILAHLKKKLKTSHYTTVMDFFTINKAVSYIDQGKQKENLGLGTASEIVAYAYALGIAFARIPILSPLVDKLMEAMNSSNRQIYLRRVSILSVRHFTSYKMAAIEGNREQMVKIAKNIFNENLAAVQKMEGQAIYQVYESDPFFNIAFIAELSFGLFTSDEQSKLVQAAQGCMEAVLKRDMSKNHAFTESANSHSHKLNALLRGEADPADVKV